MHTNIYILARSFFAETGSIGAAFEDCEQLVNKS